MKLSVVVISYNQANYIRQTMLGVLSQQVKVDWEIVVGDDCSSDGTAQILASLSDEHPARIRIVPRERNLGMIRNFENTIAASKGEYVALIEGDDYWTSPDKLQRQVEFLDAHPQHTICFHPVKYLYEDGRPSHVYPTRPLPARLTINDLLTENFIPTCSVMLRRSAIPIPFPDFLYSLKLLDWPLCALAADKGDIGQISEEMATYRVHPGGIWSMKPTDQILMNLIKMMETLDAHFERRHHPVIRETILHCYERVIDIRRAQLTAYQKKAIHWVKDYPNGSRMLSKGAIRVLVSIYLSGILSLVRRLRGVPAVVMEKP